MVERFLNMAVSITKSTGCVTVAVPDVLEYVKKKTIFFLMRLGFNFLVSLTLKIIERAPNNVIEVSLQPIKIVVWVAESRRRINWPNLF